MHGRLFWDLTLWHAHASQGRLGIFLKYAEWPRPAPGTWRLTDVTTPGSDESRVRGVIRRPRQRSAGITGLHTPPAPALHSDHTESSTFLPELRETHKKRSQVYSPPGHQMYPPITICHCWLLYSVGVVFSLQTVLGTSCHPFYLLSNCPIIFSKVKTLIQRLSLFPSHFTWAEVEITILCSVLFLFRCLLVSLCLRTELRCFSTGLM